MEQDDLQQVRFSCMRGVACISAWQQPYTIIVWLLMLCSPPVTEAAPTSQIPPMHLRLCSCHAWWWMSCTAWVTMTAGTSWSCCSPSSGDPFPHPPQGPACPFQRSPPYIVSPKQCVVALLQLVCIAQLLRLTSNQACLTCACACVCGHTPTHHRYASQAAGKPLASQATPAGRAGAATPAEENMPAGAGAGCTPQAAATPGASLRTPGTTPGSSSGSQSQQLQLIGMSATLPNMKDVATWLDAQLFVTTWRPVQLRERLLVDRQVRSGCRPPFALGPCCPSKQPASLSCAHGVPRATRHCWCAAQLRDCN